MKIIHKNQKGFTLIEILAALVILTIVITVFMAFFTNDFKYNSMTSDKLKAVNLIRSKQVEIQENHMLNSFIDSISYGGSYSIGADWTYIGTSSNLDNSYQFEIIQVPYTIEIYLKQVDDYHGSYYDQNGNKEYVKLYRLYFQVFKDNKMLSDSLAYYEFR